MNIQCLLLICFQLCFPLRQAITFGRITSRKMEPSVALIHIARNTRRVRGNGYTYKLKDEYCTGSLISRQVLITAGHCIRGKSGSTIMVNFMEKQKLLLFRTVQKYHIFRQVDVLLNHEVTTTLIMNWYCLICKNYKLISFQSGEDIALVLLNKPVYLCDESDPEHERVGVARLPLGSLRYRWTDNEIKSAKCTIFGYGKNEKRSKIDFRLRSMQINLKMSKSLVANLSNNQKICPGDSGGPVICSRGDQSYLVGITTAVISAQSSKIPQLCAFRASDGKYAVITSAKFYDIRRGISQILRFLNVHGQINNMLNDYLKCFNGTYRI
ncbi:unnamed protein product [Thelazia callipaeda]|uniref:Peptidase S1 domain-containing protein n=1 Tax=Thelazia callipaeda TaxID=103827 RepID=A0A158RCL2_THECL|nr:unnamed protein product [Thelazia callipaeda]